MRASLGDALSDTDRSNCTSTFSGVRFQTNHPYLYGRLAIMKFPSHHNCVHINLDRGYHGLHHDYHYHQSRTLEFYLDLSWRHKIQKGSVVEFCLRLSWTPKSPKRGVPPKDGLQFDIQFERNLDR